MHHLFWFSRTLYERINCDVWFPRLFRSSNLLELVSQRLLDIFGNRSVEMKWCSNCIISRWHIIVRQTIFIFLNENTRYSRMSPRSWHTYRDFRISFRLVQVLYQIAHHTGRSTELQPRMPRFRARRNREGVQMKRMFATISLQYSPARRRRHKRPDCRQFVWYSMGYYGLSCPTYIWSIVLFRHDDDLN